MIATVYRYTAYMEEARRRGSSHYQGVMNCEDTFMAWLLSVEMYLRNNKTNSFQGVWRLKIKILQMEITIYLSKI